MKPGTEIIKPVYHQSNLIHYYTCPQKMELSFTHPIEQSMAMREGLLFELWVLGMNPRAKEAFGTQPIYEAGLIGKKKAETLDIIKNAAEHVKKQFITGEAYQKLTFEDENYINEGEADFIGMVEYSLEGETLVLDCICDLKFTSNLSGWDFKNSFSEFFQAIYYSYILFKMTGQIKPFMFKIVQNSFEVPIVANRIFTFNESDFEKLKKDLDMIHNDIVRLPKAIEQTCIKGPYNKQCDFLEFCQAGRQFVENCSIRAYSSLFDDSLSSRVKG